MAWYHKTKSWHIKESFVTSEACYISRRNALKTLGLGAGISVSTLGAGGLLESAIAQQDQRPSLKGAINPLYQDAGRAITPEQTNLTYNNYYEFGGHKRIATAAQKLSLDGWRVKISGLVEQPFELDFDDFQRRYALEERIYRHRCVEAWSMVVPWIGFSLASVVASAKPLASASYVRFHGFEQPQAAVMQKLPLYPWPYTEGMTIAEAQNELSFLATGAYGKTLAKQMGAPLRLHLPWKYGFKSIKGITEIEFTDQRPTSFWQTLDANEYGFWANVNPAVAHPRWSQLMEQDIETGNYFPTRKFNGYGEQVADLYSGLQDEALYR